MRGPQICRMEALGLLPHMASNLSWSASCGDLFLPVFLSLFLPSFSSPTFSCPG